MQRMRRSKRLSMMWRIPTGKLKQSLHCCWKSATHPRRLCIAWRPAINWRTLATHAVASAWIPTACLTSIG